MKNTFKYIIVAAAFSAMAFMSGSSAFAQNLPDGVYLEKDGLAYRKSATLKEGTTDKYIIDLEAFVTGAVTVKNTSIPADIVLVLDVSGSMAWNITTGTFTARASQAYSYNSYGDNTYYVLYNGSYYPVERYQSQSGRRRLRFTVGNTTYYLSGTGVTTTAPTNVNNNYSTIWTGVLYEGGDDVVTQPKITALKTAVGAFIDQILYNDMYDEDGNRRKDKDGNDTYLGNQISIVKFAGDQYVTGNADYNDDDAPLTEGNDTYNEGGNTYNCTQVVKKFYPTSTSAAALKTAVNGLSAAGATSADYGLNLARLLINGLGEDRSESAKTVVFFTDGSPTYGSSYDGTVAGRAVANAYSIKNAGASVFTVGVFDNITDQITNFMNYTSSNYPEARNMSQPGNPVAEADRIFFQNVSSGTDLSKVFQSIADVSGGSGNTEVTSEATVTVDVVASSFAIPSTATDASVTVLVAPCTGWSDPITYGGETKKYLTFGEEKVATEYGLPAITPHVDKAANTVSTEGFDFSANWCGYDEDEEEFHGYKQIIRFEITVAEGAVGGPNVATNDKKSGIYVNGKQLAEFNRPTVKIPVSIWIKKKGLVGEDTAVFTISYANYQSGVDPMSLPSSAWKNFTKVMITSDSPTDPEDGCPMEKLVGLDPDYFYLIKEDAWAWSYSYQDDGIQYTVGENLQNPFIFVNIPKEDIKEGESSIRNVFKKKEKTTTTTEEPEQPGGAK